MTSRARLFCGYTDNINETVSDINIWERFPYSSTGITKWRDEGKLNKIEVDGSITRFSWNGPPTWFKVDASCNVYKGSGPAVNRNIEFLWYKNGVQDGIVRGSYMNSSDSQVVSGSGMMYLETGDYVEPYIRNIENSDKILLKNCTFIFWEDSGY